MKLDPIETALCGRMASYHSHRLVNLNRYSIKNIYLCFTSLRLSGKASYTYDNMIFVGQIISFYSKAPIELHNIKV